MTGKPASGDGYAPSTVAHSETVLRRFYDFHRDCGTGPVLNPFPLDASRRRGRPHAHHNPMDEWMPERTGRYRPTVPKRIPRAIPDGWFNKLFASLPSDRDRALVAFWISTGARASELLGMRQCDFRARRAADQRGPQGHPGGAGAPGVGGRVRVAPALPAGTAADWGFPAAGGSRPGGRCGGLTGR